jgi:hypothetical protein
MRLNHPKLAKLLQQAYSAEKAAAFAYIGHAKSVKNLEQKKEIHQIELDEWNHRTSVLKIMQQYDVPISRYYEIKFHLIGKTISGACYIIGWFMPFYFAGRLESGNVCEYFRLMHYFHQINIFEHDEILFEMGIKEKEHEHYFLRNIDDHRLLPFFERIFNWGKRKSYNDINLNELPEIQNSNQYCKNFKKT